MDTADSFFQTLLQTLTRIGFFQIVALGLSGLLLYSLYKQFRAIMAASARKWEEEEEKRLQAARRNIKDIAIDLSSEQERQSGLDKEGMAPLLISGAGAAVDPHPKAGGVPHASTGGTESAASSKDPAAKSDTKTSAESAKAPPAPTKPNPFKHDAKPVDAGKDSPSSNTPQTGAPSFGKTGPQTIVTASGLEIDQVALSQNNYFERVQESTGSNDPLMTTKNYRDVYQQKLQREAETKQAEIQKAQENQHQFHLQHQLQKNAAMAQQARQLEARLTFLRGQLGQGNDETGIHAAISQCEIQLGQIPIALR
jgi:hypothetical protein